MEEIKKIYNQLASRYDSKYKTTKCFVEEEIIASFLPENLNGKMILDIGCGTGNMITVGRLPVKHYLGVDISENMLKEAKIKYPDYDFKQQEALTNVYGGLWDIVLSVFGQMNYMGIEDWIIAHKCNLDYEEDKYHQDSRFLSVVYAEGYSPSYIEGHSYKYKLEDIRRELNLHGFEYNIFGLSFDVLGAEKLSFENLLQQQTMLTYSGNLEGCQYWIIEGTIQGVR
tara:strand:+ start:16928 stop:17608 length:681 start_codon:yes stop_codon:yes gene_type:complete